MLARMLRNIFQCNDSITVNFVHRVSRNWTEFDLSF